MPQSLANILIHIIFSTKYRADSITPEIETELYKYIATTCRSFECPSIQIGGTKNHIHILCRLSRTIAVSELVMKIKTGSSKWIKTKGPEYSNFSWQNGYGAFSIGASNLQKIRNYITNQKKHHGNRSFQEEYVEFLKKYGMEYDERYLWD